MRRILLVLALLLVACGGPKKSAGELPVPATPDAAAAATDELPATLVARVDRAVGFMESIASAAEANASDCAAMGDALQALADGPDGKVLIEMDLDPEYQAHSNAVAERYGERLGSVSGRIGEAIKACDTGPVYDALHEMGLQ